jgi:dihydrofolate synthase/folylpolyglutamate synthase
MQRLSTGTLADRVRPAELWLDGGHNPAAGAALAATLDGLPERPTHLVCGMLDTKDITGYMTPLARHAEGLTAIAIPGEAATLPAETTARAAAQAGMAATTAPDLDSALQAIIAERPGARILICGSLYLAGHVLRANA